MHCAKRKVHTNLKHRHTIIKEADELNLALCAMENMSRSSWTSPTTSVWINI